MRGELSLPHFLQAMIRGRLQVGPGLLAGQAGSSVSPVRTDLCLYLASLSQATPKLGDLIEIFRFGYRHWAIYVGNGYVVHLAPPSKDGFSV